MLSTVEHALNCSIHGYQLPAQPVSRHPALTVPQFDQAALSCEHFHGELSAVLCSHRSLHRFDQSGYRAAVVLELFGGIVNIDSSSSADVFVVGTFVGIEETSPPADVIDQDNAEIRSSRFDVGQ